MSQTLGLVDKSLHFYFKATFYLIIRDEILPENTFEYDKSSRSREHRKVSFGIEKLSGKI